MQWNRIASCAYVLMREGGKGVCAEDYDESRKALCADREIATMTGMNIKMA